MAYQSRWPLRRRGPRAGPDRTGLHYDPRFVGAPARAEILTWLKGIRPLWEQRFSTHRPPPNGQAQRWLLRPVYWLGNWQFACLDYYRPPHGVDDRCVRAEPFPPVLAAMVPEIEARAKQMFSGADVPEGWTLNTCLVNLYGRRREGERWVDTARVGEHRDFEPGPVASVSLGERALFQFVRSQKPGERDGVVSQQWLDDGSLQIFGGVQWKRHTFHRVQRVDQREGVRFDVNVSDFETRRLNFTFRYVPRRNIVRFAELSETARKDVEAYVETLAESSPFFARELAHARRKQPG